MRSARLAAVMAAPLLLASGIASAAPERATTAARHLPGTHCNAFPANSVWHASIAELPVNRLSAEWVRNIGGGDLHPDFGPSYGEQPAPYGIPITYVSGGHATVKVKFQYSSESDHVGYPLGADTKVEGGESSSGDRHAIVVNSSTCRVYETWHTSKTSHGWTAGSGATWSLKSNKLRHDGWTSSDAAGLAILPGLLRVGEVKAGYVDHAIRFTAPESARRYLWPARHQAGSTDSSAYPPMGARFRLKASFDTSGYSQATQVVLQAMQTYGMILADNGSSWYFQGEASSKWPSKMLDELKDIPGSAFEAVDESSLQAAPNSGKVN